MLENLRVSAGIVAPFFIYLVIGIVLRRMNIIGYEFAGQMNKFITGVLMPVNIFNSIYKSDLGSMFSTLAVPYSMGCVLLSMFVLIFASRRISPDPARQGAIVHSGYRGNVMLFALPIAQGIYGDSVPEVVIILTSFMIMSNTSVVPMMEYYRDGARRYRGEEGSAEKAGLGNVLVHVSKNAMLWGVVLGALWALSGLKMPAVGEKVVSGITGTVVPLAFMMLGARMDIGHLKKNNRTVMLVTLYKLVIMPLVFILPPVFMGWDEKIIVGLLAAFASPSAIVSYTMTEAYGCDGDLSGEIVAVSSMISLFTLFLWIFCFKQLGVIS